LKGENKFKYVVIGGEVEPKVRGNLKNWALPTTGYKRKNVLQKKGKNKTETHRVSVAPK